MKAFSPILFPLFGILPLAAQSTISTVDNYAYSANAGWIDFRPSAVSGAVATDTYLTGHAYAANFGWISLGSGTPDNEHTFSNSSATDYGVNIAPDGKLAGYAYAANIGWIVFEQSHGKPELDLCTGKFTGFAYSANIGWIPLDTPSSDLVSPSLLRPDSDSDGIADGWEELHFGNLTTATATSDRDGDGQSDLNEYHAGTEPGNASSSLRILSQSYPSDTQAIFTFSMVSTRRYRVEYDDDLAPPWTDSPLGTFKPPGRGSALANISGLPADAPRRFFRVVAVSLPTRLPIILPPNF